MPEKVETIPLSASIEIKRTALFLDFSIAFWIKPKGVRSSGSLGSWAIENGFIIENYYTELIDNKKRYIISKSKTKNVYSDSIKDFATPTQLNYTTEQISKVIPAEKRFPYEIYMQSSSLFFVSF